MDARSTRRCGRACTGKQLDWIDPDLDRVTQRLTGSSPEHQASIRSLYSIGDWQFDVTVRYVDDLPTLDVPAYVGADLRLARRWPQGHEIALVGQDLLDDRHAEFRSVAVPVATEVDRGVYLEFSWRQ